MGGSHTATGSLATAFRSIGLTCDSVLSHTLSRAIGDVRARELVLLAEPLTCEHAQTMGLVTRSVEPGHVLDTAMNLASRLAAAPTRAFTESKRLLAESHLHSLQDNLAAEALGQSRAGSGCGQPIRHHVVEHFDAVQRVLGMSIVVRS